MSAIIAYITTGTCIHFTGFQLVDCNLNTNIIFYLKQNGRKCNYFWLFHELEQI